MTEIDKRRADRLKVMQAIFDASEGSESIFVSGPDLLNNFGLGLTDQELRDACKFLENENLIKGTRSSWGHYTPYMIQITHRGIKEMERSRESPTEPTSHFPPAVSIVHVAGNVIGSAIQSGSPGAQQDLTIGDLDLKAITDFLNELETRAPEIGLPEAKRKELAAEIATIRAQVDSPRPKKEIIRESLRSVRSILEGAGSVLVATGLLALLPHIHF